MNDYLLQHGNAALFVTSFLASTLIPIGSEWLLVALLLQKHEPVPTVITATLGNYLGSCTSYWIGVRGGDFLIRKILRVSTQAQERAELIYRRLGSWSLLFSWLPVVGDPLCVAGGLFKARFATFTLFVFSGKLARYAVVAWVTLGGERLWS